MIWPPAQSCLVFRSRFWRCTGDSFGQHALRPLKNAAGSSLLSLQSSVTTQGVLTVGTLYT
ncbi:Complex 1 protein containing protein [Zea mays]|uniref:Complex 1 protein containing protein n=1 Tax=Zea mays TaxID=4577 RepID=A0A1D6K7Z6_MAIZE|nr:Complex 1 protein containing protein [Zea mays]